MLKKHKIILSIILIIYLSFFIFSQDVTKLPSRSNNDYIMLNEKFLLEIQKNILSGKDLSYKPAIDRVIAEANILLKKGPYSVMYKKSIANSGDKHDYISIGIYWWPDPSKPDGKPYISKDGQTNPESGNDTFDKSSLQQFIASIQTFTLAYLLTGEQSYANYAAELIKVWFLYPETSMNPNMNYGQAVPGLNDGRAEGIIETVQFINVVEAIKVLYKNSFLSKKDYSGLQRWFKSYLKWLTTNNIGLEAFKKTNNHGTWYAVQVVQYAKFTNQKNIAKKILEEIVPSRINSQMTVDGKFPEELERTRPLHYTLYNLTPLMILAYLAEEIGIDYWNYKTEDGKSIRKALDFILPYLEGKNTLLVKGKEAKEKMSFQTYFSTYLRYASIKYKDKKYLDASNELIDRAYKEETDKFGSFGPESDRSVLIFPVESVNL